MEILVGTAGIPDSAKSKPTVEAIKALVADGLQAMEVEFVRQVYMTNKQAEEVGKVAEENKISLSVHAPYFINLSSEKTPVIHASEKRILDSVERAANMKARIVAIHAGYYGKFSPEETFQRIKISLERIHSAMKEKNLKGVLLGLETTGKEKQWGTLEEILKMCKEVPGCYPYIDFGHLFVKHNGSINYAEIIDTLKNAGYKNLYAHFEGVEKRNGKFADIHTPISDYPPFEPLAKELVKKKLDSRIICESSLPESDALKMKGTLEKAGYSF